MNIQIFATVALISTVAVSTSQAQEIKAGDLTISQPWSRATPKSAPVGAGYLTIRNNGSKPDKLLGGVSDVSKEVQVHEMTMDGGVMKMRQLALGLEVPAGGTVELKPSSYHLMLMELNSQLVQGTTVKITLNFEHAGKVPVEFKIGGVGANGPSKASEGMQMDHGMKGMGGM